MKKSLVFAMIMAMFASLASAQAVDSESVARAFLAAKVASSEGGFRFDRVMPDRTETVEGRFTLDDKGNVVELFITENGVESAVSIGNPRSMGLDHKGAATNFWIWLYALGDEGEVLAYGNGQDLLLEKEEPIVIKLTPAWVSRFIPYTPPAGVALSNIALRFTGGGNGELSYDQNRGGFLIWVDPRYPDVSYEIFDRSNGIIYATGGFNVLTGEEQDSTENIMNLVYEAGVVKLFTDAEQLTLTAQQLDGMVTRDDVEVSAKVYMAELGGGSLNISTWALNGRIEIRAWTVDGELPVIASKEGYEPYVALPAGYDKVIITITGKPASAGFGLWAIRGSGGSVGKG